MGGKGAIILGSSVGSSLTLWVGDIWAETEVKWMEWLCEDVETDHSRYWVQCMQGPQVGMWWLGFQNGKNISLPGAEWMQGRSEGTEVKGREYKVV